MIDSLPTAEPNDSGERVCNHDARSLGRIVYSNQEDYEAGTVNPVEATGATVGKS